MKNNLDQFNVLRKVKGESKTNQRKLAKELNFSLGKLNYCLKSLKDKGLIKISNFKQNPKKINYIYLLTPKGIAFLVKQKALMARNKQRYKTSVKYGLAPHTLSGPAGNETHIRFIGDLENPRLYNMLSLAALPGLSSVARLSINKMDPGLVVQPYFDSIADVVQQRIIDLATTVKDTIIREFKEGIGKTIKGHLMGGLSRIKIPQGITQGINEIKETSATVDRMRKSFDRFVSDVKDLGSKNTALKIHPFSKELARSGESDLVNLIPYGEDEYGPKDKKKS